MFSIEKYRDILLKNGYDEALINQYHFWKVLTDKTAFIVNLKKLENGVGVVYGVCSTAVLWSDGDWEWHRKLGTADNDCNLRYYVEITNVEQELSAEAEISRLYNEFRAIEKDALLNIVKDLRKQFIQEITNILKPLGFRKRGNQWRTPLTENLVLQFWADRCPYTDLYYFQVDIFPLVSSKGWCYSKRLKAIGTDIFDWKKHTQPECRFDWQLQSANELKNLIAHLYQTELLPLINTDITELGKQTFIWKCCTCSRNRCETCWVEKNFWEAKEL